MIILLVTCAVLGVVASAELPPSCHLPVFCDSKLLHHVQMSRIYNDSKTFVDYMLKQDQNTTLEAFDDLLKRTNNSPDNVTIKAFVEEYFNTKPAALDEWYPEDYKLKPAFLANIRDDELREFGQDVHKIWPSLGRIVKPEVNQNPDRTSFISVPNGFIIPGGRFKELYYWDTFWIIEGLLVSGMEKTVKGMLGNLLELLKKVGHIPNGSRWYYQERSQPPLLIAMMSLYFRRTADIDFLRENIRNLEIELEYWLDTQQLNFDINGKKHSLLRYYAPSKGPRPESYYEDYTNAQVFGTEERESEFYVDIKSAAESGWDFSSRWFIDQNGNNTGNLTNIHTEYLIPVDLNAIFANALQNMVYFHSLLGNRYKMAHWSRLARQWRADIEDVLWNEEDGVWYDYDLKDKKPRKYFYPSNVAPLWMGVVEKENLIKHAPRVIKYLHNSEALDFPGGVPTSLIHSKEQWDLPNAWPPLVSIVVGALEAMDLDEGYEMAFEVAQTWVRACYKGYKASGRMYEKYSASNPGQFGEGGEYQVQDGFGWSNGVVLEFLAKYGQKLTANDSGNETGNSTSSAPLKVLKVLGIADAAKGFTVPSIPVVSNIPVSS